MGKGPRIDCSKDKPLTQQSAKDECDINIIIERLKRGADIPMSDANKVPRYGDFTQIPTDLRECLLVVKHADDLFMTLDARVRARFENDPAQLLDFLNDPNNRQEAVELGLVDPPKVEDKPVIEQAVEEPVAPVKKASKKASADQDA